METATTDFYTRNNTTDADTLNVILESAYEGIAVVDAQGIVVQFNDAYSRFTGIKKEDALGRHVTEVIDNTNLHNTVKTGIPERGVLQTIQGNPMVVHRIPIWKDGKVAGAIGMLIFEGVSELYHIYEKLQNHALHQQAEWARSSAKRTSTNNGEKRVTIAQIIGESARMSEVKRLARRAARTSATVLITGESGTGKELFAKSIHYLSPFADGPLITVNCGAIPENLIESELFGYEEGAFTGARKGGKPGKVELANNGTLFLDEIGEMPLPMQTKLLRALQEKEAERVGGITKYDFNARIVAATNRNLEEMVAKGEFREDLYYRLNIIRLHVPSLRERKSDIPILLSHYLTEVCKNYRIPEKRLTSEAVAALIRYHWPGNIREMVNIVERLVTLVEKEWIGLEHLQVNRLAAQGKLADNDNCGNYTYYGDYTLRKEDTYGKDDVYSADSAYRADGTAGVLSNGTAGDTPNGTTNGTAGDTPNGTTNGTAGDTSNGTTNGTATEQQAVGGESASPHNFIAQIKAQGREQERMMLIHILRMVRGNKTAAAKMLGIHRTTLYQKLKKHGIS